jgi:hypothetical protein
MHIITAKGKTELHRLIAEKRKHGFARRGRVLLIDREDCCQIMIERVK